MTEERDVSALRPLAPVGPAVTIAAARGAPPRMIMVPLWALRVNPAYQRELSRRSVALIGRIAANWDWRRVKALSVAPVARTPDGMLYEVIDGQHTATAALIRGDIPELPCLVAAGETVEAAARAFAGINRDRVAMTPAQVFHAELAAGDPAAAAIAAGVAAAGGRVLRHSLARRQYRPGDTLAITALREVHAVAGEDGVAAVMRAARAAGLAPAAALWIKAIRILLHDDAYRGEIAAAPLGRAIAGLDLDRLLDAADLDRLESGTPRPRAVAAAIWRAIQR